MSAGFTYDSAKVYGDARRLLYEVTKMVGHFPKSYKYTLGQKLSESCTDLIASIALAFREQQNPQLKLKRIEYAIGRLDLVIVHFRLSFDLCLISRKDNSEQLTTLMSIYKQLEGWCQSQANKMTSLQSESA